MKIFLDDLRNAPDHTWIVVRSYQEFVNLLYSIREISPIGMRFVREMSLDHDLGFCDGCLTLDDDRCEFPNGCDCLCHKTGYDCVKLMEEEGLWPLDPPRVHSANPVGRKNMEAVISSWYHR